MIIQDFPVLDMVTISTELTILWSVLSSLPRTEKSFSIVFQHMKGFQGR